MNPQDRSDGTGATASAAPPAARPSAASPPDEPDPTADGTDSRAVTIARRVSPGTVISRPCQSQ